MTVVGVVVALVLAIAATAIILTLQEKRRAEEEAERAAAERVASAAAAVQGLFEAIAAADSGAALGYLEVEGSTDMITDEVLAVSAELAPITDIVVTPPVSVSEAFRSADVTISYRLGSTAVEQVYQVRDPEEDNTWVVDGALNELMLYDTFEGLEISLNGATITSEELTLLPGAYELTTSTTYFTLTGDTEFRVTDLYHAETPTFEPALTEDGVTAFREAVTAAVEECVSSTTLEAGCGLDLPEELSDDTVLEDGTLERTLSDRAQESLESMEVTLSVADPTLAEGSHIGAVDVTARCSQGEVTGTCELVFAPALGAPSIAMTDPDLVVLWD